MTKQRLDNVDGLRGLAALSVIVGHWLEMLVKHFEITKFAGPLVENIDFIYFSPGRLGVVTFFCISGFVIPFSFGGERPLRTFLLSRFFRLYPAYWFSLAVGVLIIPTIGFDSFSMKQILANITMFQFALKQRDVLGVYWTLFIEILFYTICFVSAWLGMLHSSRFNVVAMVGFMSLAVMGGAYRYTHPESTISIGVFTYLAAMHFGTLARIAYLEQKGGDRRGICRNVALLLVGAVFANTLGYIHAHDKTTGWVASNTSYVMGVALFLLCVQFRLFTNVRLVFVGAISYSLYLIHPIFIDLARYLLAEQGVAAAAALSLPIIAIGSFGAAFAMRKAIEQPAVRLGKRVVRLLDRRPTGRPEVSPRVSG